MNAATALILIGIVMFCYLPLSKPFPGKPIVVVVGIALWLIGIRITHHHDRLHQDRKEDR